MLAEIIGRLKTMSWLRVTSLRNGNRFPHSLGYVVHDWFLKVFTINYGKPIMSQTKDCVTVSLQKAGLFYHSDYSRWLLVQLFGVRVEWVICLAFCTDEMEPDLTGVFRSDPITTKKTLGNRFRCRSLNDYRGHRIGPFLFLVGVFFL